MSQLSQAEQTAGISRAALDLKRRANGDSKPQMSTKVDTPLQMSTKVHTPDKPKLLSRIIGDGSQELPIIQTSYRRFSLLELRDGLVLRDACFIGSRCDVALIHLDYHEAQALATVLRELEPPEETK